MNKPIIIDGVDVSECRNYSVKEFVNYTECPDYCADYIDHRCDNHPNCYYKQLQRLEQENLRLEAENTKLIRENYELSVNQEDLEQYKTIIHNKNIEIEQLKVENEELKTKIFDEGLRRKTCKYYKQVCSENTQLIAYRNALDEIKQLLTSSMDINLKSANKHFSLIDEAIEKVNEVLKDEHN